MKLLVTSLPDIERLPFQRFHHLLTHLSQKHEITVLCENFWWLKKEHEPFVEDLTKKIKLYHLTEAKIHPIFQELSLIRNYNSFDRYIHFDTFDVHINFGSLIAGYFMTRKMASLDIPTILDIYDDFPEMFRRSSRVPYLLRPMSYMISDFLLRKNIAACKKVTFTTASLVSPCHLPNEKSVLIPNGVDTNIFFSRSSDNLRKSLGLGDHFVLGFVGFLANWVDFGPIFAAIRELGEEGVIPNVKMLIVGKGDKFDENIKLASDYGIKDKILFVGVIPYLQVSRYISCMDVCLISFRESNDCQNSFPLKLLEYMACEKPVVSTELCGVKEAMGNRVIYASTKEKIKQVLLLLYNDQKLRYELGKDGRQFVKENYSWEEICSKYEKILS
jgi:glycosyltransferase involved in cell wall biosynthesis